MLYANIRFVCICVLVIGIVVIITLYNLAQGVNGFRWIPVHYLTLYSDFDPKESDKFNTSGNQPQHNDLTVHNQTFRILYWTKSFHGSNWFGAGNAPFKKCHYQNCFLTSNKNEYDSSDAILVNLHSLFMKPLPKNRASAEQKWIMRLNESPFYTAKFHVNSMSRYNNMFNATWTYHSKSDIWTNYNKWRFVEKTQKEIDIHTELNYADGKDILIIWFVSHCYTQSKREKYVRLLRQVVPVNIYGECSPVKCVGKSCEQQKLRSKFFLSFENSLCDEYVTEKLWNPILSGLVPIVLGAYNYSGILPPNSYIDIKDYNSAEELGKYLLKVNSNDTLYNSYFAWKRTRKMVEIAPPQCALCEYMNMKSHVRKTYPRLDVFWNTQTDCYEPNKYYPNIEKWTWY